MKMIVRTICAIIVFFSLLLLVGEPTEELTRTECILMKAGSLLGIWVAFKVFVRTLVEEERRELEDDQV